MNIVSKQIIQQLISEKNQSLVSIYLPTFHDGAPEHVREDQLRFKNILARLETLMTERKVAATIQRKIMGQLLPLQQDQQFWRRQTEGLALFVSPTALTYCNLPVTIDEHVEVGPRFYVTPLLGLAEETTPYYVLAIARQQPQLYEGDAYQLQPANIALPKDPESALHIDEITQGKGAYAVRGRQPGRTITYGRGGGEKEVVDEIKRQFFRLVDQKICKRSHVSRSLLLAGTTEEVAEYRALSEYPHILTQAIEGNHVADDLPSLHQKAWQHMRALHVSEQRSLRQRFGELVGVGRATAVLETIAAAAKEGRVESLLVGLKQTTSDNAKETLRPLTKMIFPSSHRQLLDDAARATWQCGGAVYACEAQEMPEGAMMAATLRYS